MLAGVGRIGRIGGAGTGSAGVEAFISVWATTGTFETITIPTQADTFNAVVDWGDGTTETITTYNGFSHEYAAIGEHTISIVGVFPNIYFNNGAEGLKIKRVTNLGTVGWTRLNNSFYGCTNLTEFTAGSTDTSSITALTSMFRGCSGLTSLDVSSFNTSSVNNMGFAFQSCSGLTSIVGVEDFDITGLNSTGDLNNFLTVGKMTTPQYDNLLINWEAQASVIPAMTAAFGASEYTGGGAAATAHASLTDVYGWSIGDGGIA
tara:strand:+ start:113 stop:898 length:786 start_codon:yes stop_codon:yes gene_type:complete